MKIARRLQEVRERIADAAIPSGRDPASICLVGVSKGGVSADVIAEAIDAGLTDLGENRVQEAAPKIPAVAARTARSVHWHLVGHLQSNKVKAALALFHTVQSVDSLRIAEKISGASPTPFEVFLEVQFTNAPQRYGFSPESIADAFDWIHALPHVSIGGLMTVAPLGLDESQTRAVFRTLREIRDQLQASHPKEPALGLSMGMTDDYVLAIQEGATTVRIGRAIFAG